MVSDRDRLSIRRSLKEFFRRGSHRLSTDDISSRMCYRIQCTELLQLHRQSLLQRNYGHVQHYCLLDQQFYQRTLQLKDRVHWEMRDQIDLAIIPSGSPVRCSFLCGGRCYPHVTTTSSMNDTSHCNNCTDPYDCMLCCDSNDCNSAAVSDIIRDNRLGQTCYQCAHTEVFWIPGFPYNPLCGPDFDPKKVLELSYEFCTGMCHTDLFFIKGVLAEAMRSCTTQENICDRANQTHQGTRTFRHENSYYDRTSCLGSLCNGVLNGARSTGATKNILTMIIAYYVASLALVP